jgi:hypothetical protein
MPASQGMRLRAVVGHPSASPIVVHLRHFGHFACHFVGIILT